MSIPEDHFQSLLDAIKARGPPPDPAFPVPKTTTPNTYATVEQPELTRRSVRRYINNLYVGLHERIQYHFAQAEAIDNAYYNLSRSVSGIKHELEKGSEEWEDEPARLERCDEAQGGLMEYVKWTRKKLNLWSLYTGRDSQGVKVKLLYLVEEHGNWTETDSEGIGSEDNSDDEADGAGEEADDS